MKSVLLTIRTHMRDFGPGERRIANTLLQDPKAVLPLSISQFADLTDSGAATVVRFVKKIGFSGYQSFKIALAQELSNISDEPKQISRDDSCYDMFSKRIADIRIALERTREVLDAEVMEEIAVRLMYAGRILIFGLGNSAPIAMDAQHKFMRLGLDATAIYDNHMQALCASHTNKQCVVIGISHSGASRDIVESLRLAHSMGAFTVGITNYNASPITEVADLCLFTRSDETVHSILAMSSRIAQLTIFDALYTYMIAGMGRRAVEAIHATETALREKKL